MWYVLFKISCILAAVAERADFTFTLYETYVPIREVCLRTCKYSIRKKDFHHKKEFVQVAKEVLEILFLYMYVDDNLIGANSIEKLEGFRNSYISSLVLVV